MLRFTLLYLLILLCTTAIQAQTQFQKTFGTKNNDRNYHLASFCDGTLVSTGYTYNPNTQTNDGTVTKLNAFGEVIWSKTFGSSEDDNSWDVITTKNDDIVLVGNSPTVNSPFNGGIIQRLDSNGKLLWSHGTYQHEIDVNYYRVIETSTGHLLATGLMTGCGGCTTFYVVLSKFTANGQLVWNRRLGHSEASEMMGLKETSKGNYIMCGLTKDAHSTNTTNRFLVLNTDTSGNVNWGKGYTTNGSDRLNDIIEVDRNFYFAGWTSGSGQGSDDLVLMKTDSVGNVDWSYTYGDQGNDKIFNMKYDSVNENFVLAGYTQAFGSGVSNRSSLFCKIDKKGRLKHAKAYGTSNTDGHWPTGLTTTNDHGYYILGSTKGLGQGSYDNYLIKTDTTGNSGCKEKILKLKRAKLNLSTISTSGSRDIGLGVKRNIFTLNDWNISSKRHCCDLYADIGTGKTLCPSDSITLGSKELPFYSYSWEYSNNVVDSTPKYTVKYGKPGMYILKVSAQNSNCLVKRAQTIISNYKKPDLGFDSSYRFCENDSLYLRTNANVDSINWYSIINKQYVDTGNHFISDSPDSLLLDIYAPNGCLFNDSLFVYEDSLPEYKLRDDTSICKGDSLIINLNTTDSFRWIEPALFAETIYAKDSGSYSVKFVNNSCAIRDSFQLSHYELPKFNFGEDAEMCSNEFVNIGTDAGDQFEWLKPFAYDSNFIKADQPGLYILKVSNQYCSFIDSIRLDTLAVPNYNLGEDENICEGESISLKAPKNHQFEWLNSLTQPDQMTMTESDTAIIKVMNDHCSMIDTFILNVHDNPNISLGEDTSICPDQPLFVKPHGNYHEFKWHLRPQDDSIRIAWDDILIAEGISEEGCSTFDTLNVKLHPVPDSLFEQDTIRFRDEVKISPLESWPSYNWGDESEDSVLIIEETDWYWLAILTEEGCEVKDSIYALNTTGLRSFNSNIAIYPNPAAQELRIKNVNEPTNYSIYNLNGTAISNGKLIENTINIDHLPDGRYILILNVKSKVYNRVFVKFN